MCWWWWCYSVSDKRVYIVAIITVTDYLITEMLREEIAPEEYDEDTLLTPDVRDMMEMEVCIIYVPGKICHIPIGPIYTGMMLQSRAIRPHQCVIQTRIVRLCIEHAATL